MSEEVVEGWYPTPSPVTLRYDTLKGLYSNRLLTFTFLRIPLSLAEREKGGRKGLKLKVVWEVQGGNGSGVAENQASEGKKSKNGEGFYEWVVWDDSKAVDGDGFEDGEREDVKTLGEIVGFSAWGADGV